MRGKQLMNKPITYCVNVRLYDCHKQMSVPNNVYNRSDFDVSNNCN